MFKVPPSGCCYSVHLLLFVCSGCHHAVYKDRSIRNVVGEMDNLSCPYYWKETGTVFLLRVSPIREQVNWLITLPKQVVQHAGYSNLSTHIRTQHHDETPISITEISWNVVKLTLSFLHFRERHQQHSVGLTALCSLWNFSALSRLGSFVAILGRKAYHATHF